MEDAIRPPDHAETESERGTEGGQALVEYSLILVLIVIACLAILFVFQDSVINHLWATTQVIISAMKL